MKKFFFIRLFTGEAKLWQAWWLYMVLFGILVMLLGEVAQYYANLAQTNLVNLVSFVVLLLSFFYIVSYPYVVWKCASNCKSKGWTSVARVLIVLAPIFNMSRIADNGTYRGKGILIALLCSLLIILVYLSGKISKSPKILTFNHKYMAPISLVLANISIFLGSTFGL